MALIHEFGSKEYIVDTEAVTCTCPNFKYRCTHFTIDRPERQCKHIQKVFAEHPELIPAALSKVDKVEPSGSGLDPDGKIRYPRAVFDLYVSEIMKVLKSFDIVEGAEVCGSYRRLEHRVSDLDVLIKLKNDNDSWTPILDYFENVMGFALIPNIGRGDHKAAYMIDGFVHVDFKVVPKESWPYALLHFTGSKNENITMRRRASSMGYKLNEYGLFKESDDSSVPDLKTEEDVYAFLQLPYKFPWDR